MSSSDEPGETTGTNASRRSRKRRNSLLLLLAAGLVVFAAAAGGLYYALRPVTLRIAVGPAGSDDQKLILALAQRGLAELTLSDTPLVAVLEGVEKPGNLGAILRSADGAGVDAVIVAGFVLMLLGLSGKPSPDAADALAVAICHANNQLQV